MTDTVRLLTQSVDGPYVLIDLTAAAATTLRGLRDQVVTRAIPGLLGLVVEPPAGLTARFASGLTPSSVADYRVLFSDPLNDRGPDFLVGAYRVERVHLSATGFWLYAADRSRPNEPPDVIRSDDVPFDAW